MKEKGIKMVNASHGVSAYGRLGTQVQDETRDERGPGYQETHMLRGLVFILKAVGSYGRF